MVGDSPRNGYQKDYRDDAEGELDQDHENEGLPKSLVVDRSGGHFQPKTDADASEEQQSPERAVSVMDREWIL